MKFINIYFSVLRKWWVFKGRASREEYWVFVLINIIANVILCIPVWYFTGLEPNTSVEPDFSTSVSILLSAIPLLLYTILSIPPTLGVTVRRLQDSGFRALWVFIAFIPYLGPLILLYLTTQPSQIGRNKYDLPEIQRPTSVE